ncbi:MAG: tetratricopeptide repeat protein, partial [Anaerolineales bacterium]
MNAGAAVSELDRGLVDYFAGQYVLAIRAFDRYLLNADETHDGTAHYYKALALRAIGSPESARDEFDVLIETHATADPFWDDAWDEKGYTQWAFLGDYEAAIETFLGFTARVPGHARAGEFLFFAAQVTERDGQLGRAAQLWERVPDEYPTHPLAYRARFLAGVAQYRLGKHGPAQGNFERALELAATPSEQAAATLWVGKTQVALGFP